MDNHFVINGFKRNKRNKKTHTVFLTTTLDINQITAAMKVCKYAYDSIVNADSFIASGTSTLNDWRRDADIDQHLTLFDELRIIKAIGRTKC